VIIVTKFVNIRPVGLCETHLKFDSSSWGKRWVQSWAAHKTTITLMTWKVLVCFTWFRSY